jgi:hypothetical protein
MGVLEMGPGQGAKFSRKTGHFNVVSRLLFVGPWRARQPARPRQEYPTSGLPSTLSAGAATHRAARSKLWIFSFSFCLGCLGGAGRFCLHSCMVVRRRAPSAALAALFRSRPHRSNGHARGRAGLPRPFWQKSKGRGRCWGHRKHPSRALGSRRGWQSAPERKLELANSRIQQKKIGAGAGLGSGRPRGQQPEKRPPGGQELKKRPPAARLFKRCPSGPLFASLPQLPAGPPEAGQPPPGGPPSPKAGPGPWAEGPRKRSDLGQRG